MALDLTPDELLSTTRAVRKRLDLTRPVPRDVLEECLQLAQQAPTASYSQNWHFMVVTDAEQRAALGEIWREVAYPYLQRGGGAREGQMLRISENPFEWGPLEASPIRTSPAAMVLPSIALDFSTTPTANPARSYSPLG